MVIFEVQWAGLWKRCEGRRNTALHRSADKQACIFTKDEDVLCDSSFMDRCRYIYIPGIYFIEASHAFFEATKLE